MTVSNPRSCLAIVLAAGDGTRMRAIRPKVLHEIGGRSLIGHVLAAVREAGGTEIVVVTAPDRAAVAAEARRHAPGAAIAEQAERRGTAHAVLAAREAIARGADDVLVIFGDTPLVRPDVLRALRAPLAQGARFELMAGA